MKTVFMLNLLSSSNLLLLLTILLMFLFFKGLISCTQHLSIKSDLISSSPFEFDLFDEEAPEDVEQSKEINYSIAVNPVSSDDDDDSCCDECERELLALRSSPPLPVVTGKPQLAQISHWAGCD